MQAETRYTDGGDGQIAYQVVGDGPPDLIYLSGSTSHVDVRWESPHFRERQRRHPPIGFPRDTVRLAGGRQHDHVRTSTQQRLGELSRRLEHDERAVVRSTHQAPSGNDCEASAATSGASRDLPARPAPVSASSRVTRHPPARTHERDRRSL